MSELNLILNIFEHRELVTSFFIFKFLLLLYLGRRYYLRNKYLEAILEREKIFRFLFDNSVTAILMTGKDGIILMTNRQFERLTGFSKDEVKGKKMSEIISIGNGAENCNRQKSYILNDLVTPSWHTSVIKSKTNNEFCCHMHINSEEDEKYTIMSFIRSDSIGYPPSVKST